MDLFWPAGVLKVLTVNGNTYISTAQGVFYNVRSTDVAAMEAAGCVTVPPETTTQPVSQYSMSPAVAAAKDVVEMYGQGSKTLTLGNGNSYTSTAYGKFTAVLRTDIAAMQALGALTEPPYMTQQYNTLYGNG